MQNTILEQLATNSLKSYVTIYEHMLNNTSASIGRFSSVGCIGAALLVKSSSFSDDDNGAVFTCRLSADQRCQLHFWQLSFYFLFLQHFKNLSYIGLSPCSWIFTLHYLHYITSTVRSLMLLFSLVMILGHGQVIDPIIWYLCRSRIHSNWSVLHRWCGAFARIVVIISKLEQEALKSTGC